MISKSAEDTAHYRVLFPMACCELVKVNLSIILIKELCLHLIAHLIVYLTNQMFVGRIQMQMHLQFHGGI